MLDEKLYDSEEISEGGENIQGFVADEADVGERLDRFISDKAGLSRSLVVKLIEDGNVKVGGKVENKNYKLRRGDTVELVMPEPEPDEASPEDIPLDIIYEDNDIIVINKPSGMVVHPASGVYSGTLVNALLYHCKGSLSGIGGVIRPGIVHRIDKDTSGLLVVAKNDAAHISLSEQLKTHEVSRIYHAIVLGNIKEDSGTINKPIGRHPVDRKKMAIVTDPTRKSRDAITHYEVLERFSPHEGRLTYVKCRLETGRTHQIRVHMSSIGHALLGDGIYGGGNSRFEANNHALISGQCLHAKCLELTHPQTHKKMTFECELPPQMNEILEKMRKNTVL